MKVKELTQLLSLNANLNIILKLPNSSEVPAHFHVTEVARLQKDFIDCGGTQRSLTTCVLQTWVDRDFDHRLDSTKLLKIMRLAEPILKSDELPIEVEYEDNLISQYTLDNAEVHGKNIVFTLSTKHTDCLAKDKCGIDQTPSSCCSGSRCC